MKILLKRNSASSSSLPATVNAGEPVWFKDELYVGSVGTTAGGVEATVGTPVRVAMYRDLASIDHNQTIKGNGTAFGADAAVNIAPGSNISVTANTSTNTITIANTYSYTHPSAGANTGSFGPSVDASPAHGGTFSVPYITVNGDGHVTAASTKTITLPADKNQKVKSGSSTFGDDAVVNITASGALTATATTTSGSEKIEITHNTSGVSAHTDYYGGSLNVLKIKNDTYGHITDVSYDTIATEGTYNSSSNKLMTKDATATAISTALGNLTTAMVYKGTSTGAVSSNALNAPSGLSASDLATGWVIVMAGDSTIVPSEATSGTKTTLLGKEISSNGDTKLEKGDMLIYNGTNWNVVTAEGQVVNGAAAVTVPATNTAGSAVTIATVDGTAITATFKHDTSGVSASSYGPSSNASPSHGGTFSVPYFTVNSAGHITAASTKTITLPADANDNQKVKSGSNTFGDNAVVNITASTGLTTSVTTTSGSEKIEIKHDTPSGAATTTSGFYKIATDSYGHVTGTTAVTASDITGLVTIPAPANNGTLTIKGQYTGSSGSTSDSSGGSLFTANQSGGSTLTITGTGGIKTYRNTTSNAITVQHTNSVTAVTTAAFKKVKYDAYGHITGSSDVAWSDITGLSGYTDNDHTYSFSTNAENGKFSATASGQATTVTLTEIDGGTF